MRRNVELTFCTLIKIPLVTAILMAASVRAEKDPEPFEEELAFSYWLSGEFLLADHGLRGQIADEYGISFFANYTVDVQGNPVGGLNNELRYATLGFFGVDSKLGTLTQQDWLTGWSIYAAGYNAEGKNLANDIGNAIQPSNLFSGVVPVGLAQVYVRGQWDDIQIDFGRITPEDYYATSELWDYFVSLAYDDNPWNLNTNNANFAGSPGALWMLEAEWQINQQWSVSVAAANTSRPDLTDPSKRGVDFHFDPLDGTLFMAEIAFDWHISLGDAPSLPGSVQIGGYYDTAEFTRITAPPAGISPTKAGLGAAWVILEQQLLPGDDKNDIGLTAWALASWGGPDSIANSPWFFSGGLVYQGIIPSRPDDALAFGYAVNWFNDQLVGQNHESNLELTYMVQLLPWLSVQPDLQWIIDPNGMTAIDNALVLGFQCSATF